MSHLPHLIQDLALILITAGFVTVLFRWIGQPVVLGYILAGSLVGPHMSLFPTVSDLPNVQVWADIGVIFLLFALGLEFSFKKLIQVGGAASVTGIVEVMGMLAIGFLTAQMFSWSTMDSLFLGGILAISSTTIIIRAFEEAGVKARGFANLVFGILIVEDLVAILLLVLLSSVAVTHQLDGNGLVFSILKLTFFTALWFLSGIFILPSILKFMRPHINSEMLVVVSIGLCFAMVVLATKAGFSPALGAFIMGSILAETSEADRIEHLVKPVKDLFAAVFFVSVGMMINPQTIAEYAVPILIITLVTVVGKFSTTVLGAVISGRSLRHAVQSGLSLAQIGEFSFIIATLGITLKVTSEFLYPIAVGVSVITTFLTPYLIRFADPIYGWIERRLPLSLRESLVRYSSSAQRLSGREEWGVVLRSYALTFLINSVLITAVFLATLQFLVPMLKDSFHDRHLANLLGLSIAILASAPFFWALFMRRVRRSEIANLWTKPENRAGVIGLEAIRLGAIFALFTFLTLQFIALKWLAAALIVVGFLLVFLFSRGLRRVYARLEDHFLQNLSVRETESKKSAVPLLAPWDAHISQIEIPPRSPAAGKTLEELKIRESFGVTIAMIERGEDLLTAPSRHERLFPADKISVIGTDEQIAKLLRFVEPKGPALPHTPAANYKLKQLRIGPHMPFCGKSIRDSGIREQTGGLVVGVERADSRILNPGSDFEIQIGDLLWVAGDIAKLSKLEKLS